MLSRIALGNANFDHDHSIASVGSWVLRGGTRLSGAALVAIAASSVRGSRRIRTFSANPDSALLGALADYATSGVLLPVIDRVHPLVEIAAARQAL